MIRRWIQAGLLAVVALMPFHAFLSVWLGSITHHQAIIQAWKEVVLLVLCGLGAALVIRDPEARDRLRSWPVLAAGLFALIAVLVTAATRPGLSPAAFGAKTDLEFLAAFVLAVIVATPHFVKRLMWAVLIPSVVVIGFGLLQVFVLPPDFLTHFGYGPNTIVPYETLDPAVKSLRFPSTLGGPNQLGTYLLLPMALAALLAIRRRRWWWLLLAAAGAVVLVHTYSRAAWIGALCASIVLLLGLASPRVRLIIAAIMVVLAGITAAVLTRLLKAGSNLQYYILHGNQQFESMRGSDYQHLNSLREGLSNSLAKPLGHGLGTAGPAFFHTGQGIVIENYYLQIAYETGLAGAVAFVLLLAATARELAHQALHHDLAAAALATLIGVSVTSLFLPAWTDSTTALMVWTAAGAVIGLPRSTSRV